MFDEILKNHSIDMDYIEGWLREFDATLEEKKLLATFREIRECR